MKELLITLATGLVDDKDAVSVVVDEPNEEGVVVYHLKVAADDMGKVIGKQGRVAKLSELLCVLQLTVSVKKYRLKLTNIFLNKLRQRCCCLFYLQKFCYNILK